MSDSESDLESEHEDLPPLVSIDLLTNAETGSVTLEESDFIRVKWQIEKFGTTRFACGEWVSSPAFSTVPFWETDWSLRLYPNGNELCSRNNLSLCLYNLSNKCQFRRASVSFYLIDVDGAHHMEHDAILEVSSSCGYVWKNENFAHRPVVFGLRKKLFPEGTLTIVFELDNLFSDTAACPQNVNRETQTASKSHCDPQIKLSQDMVALLKDANMCDVTLRAEGRDLHAHKLILAARSRVFCSMFEHLMREKVDNFVEVEDIEFDCLERFVTYLYSGDTGDLTTESALGLLAAADKYDVQDLCDICARYLQEHLDIEHSLQVLVVADLHGVAGLKEVTLAFVCRHFEEVSAKPDWRQQLKERPHLAAELLVAMTETEK